MNLVARTGWLAVQLLLLPGGCLFSGKFDRCLHWVLFIRVRWGWAKKMLDYLICSKPNSQPRNSRALHTRNATCAVVVVRRRTGVCIKWWPWAIDDSTNQLIRPWFITALGCQCHYVLFKNVTNVTIWNDVKWGNDVEIRKRQGGTPSDTHPTCGIGERTVEGEALEQRRPCVSKASRIPQQCSSYWNAYLYMQILKENAGKGRWNLGL